MFVTKRNSGYDTKKNMKAYDEMEGVRQRLKKIKRNHNYSQQSINCYLPNIMNPSSSVFISEFNQI